MIDQLTAERHDISWWRTPDRPIPADPQAYEHRRALLDALVGWRAPEREPQWRPTALSTDELIDEVLHLSDTAAAGEIAARLDMRPGTVARRLGRAGRPDLARAFWAADKQERQAAA